MPTGDNLVLHIIEFMLIARAREGADAEKQLLLDFFKSHRTNVAYKMSLLHRLQKLAQIADEEKIHYWDGENIDIFQTTQLTIVHEVENSSLTEADQIRYEQTLDLLKAGKSKQARSKLLQLCKQHPDEISIRGNIAASWMAEDKQRGIAEYEAVVKKFPDYIFARCVLAKHKIAEGQFEEANELISNLLNSKKTIPGCR